DKHGDGGKVLRKVSAAAWVRSRKSRRRLLYVLCWRWGTAVGIFLFQRGQEPSSQRHANRVLGRHARRSGSDFETRARRWREKPRGSRSLRGLQSGLLRLLFRRPRWQQTRNLLPGKAGICRLTCKPVE